MSFYIIWFLICNFNLYYIYIVSYVISCCTCIRTTIKEAFQPFLVWIISVVRNIEIFGYIFSSVSRISRQGMSDILVIYVFRFFFSVLWWETRSSCLEKLKLQRQGFWHIKGFSVYVTHPSAWKRFSSLFSFESDLQHLICFSFMRQLNQLKILSTLQNSGDKCLKRFLVTVFQASTGTTSKAKVKTARY